MDKNDRLIIAKETAKSIIETTGSTDYIGVVSFSTDAYKVSGNSLLRATSYN